MRLPCSLVGGCCVFRGGEPRNYARDLFVDNDSASACVVKDVHVADGYQVDAATIPTADRMLLRRNDYAWFSPAVSRSTAPASKSPFDAGHQVIWSRPIGLILYESAAILLDTLGQSRDRFPTRSSLAGTASRSRSAVFETASGRFPLADEKAMRNPRLTVRQGGFTLLEMLVAITVLALLTIGLTQGVRTGFAFWASQARRSAEVTELDSTARVLRNLMTDIPIRPAIPGAGQVAILFEGHSALLSFVGDLPTGFGDSRRAKIDIALRGDDLVLDWTPHRHEVSSSPPPRPAEVRLLRGVKTLDLAYWGDPGGSGRAAGWLPEWVSPALPELVRIRLSFGKGDDRHWPDLVAAPQLRAPAS